MTENFILKGTWFLPQNPDKRLSGTLTFDLQNGAILELIGSFDDNDFLPDLRNEDFICGVTTESKEVTLYKSFITHRSGPVLVSGSEIGISVVKYIVNYVFICAHIQKQEDLKFNGIKCQIRNLDEWIGISGFKNKRLNEEQIEKKEFEIKYRLPEQIKFKLDKNITGTFNFKIKPPGWSSFQKEYRLKQNIEVIFSAEEDQDFELLTDYYYQFQNFLILGLYSKTHPYGITLSSKKFVKDVGFETEILQRKDVYLYVAISNRDETKSLQSTFDMFFGYHDIKEKFPELIKKWFVEYEVLKPATNLLMEQFYNAGRFSENTFLNLAQAAETFHARINNHTKMSKIEYAEMKKNILTAVDRKYHNWLREQFSFGNNLNLAQRLDELVQFVSTETLEKIIGDKKEFADQIRWSRNYYTHYSPSGKKKALSGTPLFHLSEKIKIVLTCAMLKQIGLSIETIEILLKRSNRRLFNHLTTW
jgi:hypothetical protein